MDLLQGCETVMRELIRGHELTSQLKTILWEAEVGDGRHKQVEVLVEEISGSFTRSINALGSKISKLSCPSSRALQEDQGDRIAKTLDPVVDWSTGRRRRECPGAQKFILPTPPEDGHCWKKYGQKNILGAKYPRSYFKCSQKKDKGCQAIKQVQRTQDVPAMYLVTYVGQHTCTNALYASQLDAGASSPTDQCLLSFESDQPISMQEAHLKSFQYPAFDEALLATDSRISSMAMSDARPSFPATYEASCSNVAPGMLSPANIHTTDMNPIVHLLESDAGFCSDGSV